MYLDSNLKKECCGCGACSSICPQKVIEMVKDIEGFAYPQLINKKACVHCDQCRRVCSFVCPSTVQTKPNCYAGWLEDDEQRRLSTSGGAFMAIADAAFRFGYEIFYGAVYDERGLVIHRGVPFDYITELRGTKYLQSEVGNCYAEIKDKLTDGCKIMFVGTPCQVNGLQKYIGEKGRKNLLTVALVCHGVASPLVFQKYRDEMKSAQHGSVERVIFRDKVEKRPQNISSCTTLVFEDGYMLSEAMNSYTMAFGLGLMQRPSCSACPFATIYRDCDITIGDFWGIEDYQSELSRELQKGISLILTHSEKGMVILSQFKGFCFEEKPIEWAVNNKQPQLLHPNELNSRREQFIRNVLIKKKSFVKTANYEILRWRITKKLKEFL